jgi:ABC-2 type transport system permease protein
MWERTLTAATSFFPSSMQVIMIKEVKTFFRDTSQWSQLNLLAALIVVYVYNFSVLPLGGNPLVTFYFKNVIAFVNLALAAFVVASVAVRFVYPSISMEGRAFWIMKSGPVDASAIWWAKFWTGAVPLLILGEILVLATNSYLEVVPFMMWLSAGTLFAMIFSIVALALAVGVTYPNFDADNAAKVASGGGGLIYMVLCMSFIGAVVVLEAWPVYAIFSSRFKQIPLDTASLVGISCSLLAVAALTITVFAKSVSYGIRRLDRIEL